MRSIILPTTASARRSLAAICGTSISFWRISCIFRSTLFPSMNSLPTSAHNNQSILLLSYFEQLSPEVQNIVLKEVKALTKPQFTTKAVIPTFHGITASFNSSSYFIAFFQRSVSYIILPPAFCYRFPFTPYISYAFIPYFAAICSNTSGSINLAIYSVSPFCDILATSFSVLSRSCFIPF